MKQTPARQQQQQQICTRSNTESQQQQHDAVVQELSQRLEFNPLLSQRSTQERRSYYNKNQKIGDYEYIFLFFKCIF